MKPSMRIFAYGAMVFLIAGFQNCGRFEAAKGTLATSALTKKDTSTPQTPPKAPTPAPPAHPAPPAPPAPPPPPSDSIPKPGSLVGLTPSGPITLQSNRVYSGLRISNPNGRCVYGNQVANVRITNSEIGPCGSGSDPEHSGIFIHTSSNIQVDHNIIHDAATGIVGVNSTSTVFSHNYVYNIRGPFPAGQIIMFDKMHGNGNKILCNIGANTESDTMEDNINLWMSRGTPESFIEVAFNKLRGGHSKTGSGIILGDGDGSGFIDAHDNTIVNVNNAGMAVVGGTNMKMRNNRIYNNGTYTSVGMSVRNFYSGCDTVEVSGNRVFGVDRVWGMNGPWHFLNTGQCSNITNVNNAFGDASLTAAIFDEPYPQCK